MTLPSDLSAHPRAFRADSIPVPCQVYFAKTGGEIQTLEGRVRYASGDAIVTGVQGESWPIHRARFMLSYEPVPPTESGEDGTYCKRASEVWALVLDAPIEIPLPKCRGVLKGNVGDVLVQYPSGGQAIVSGDIFEKTYECQTDR